MSVLRAQYVENRIAGGVMPNPGPIDSGTFLYSKIKNSKSKMAKPLQALRDVMSRYESHGHHGIAAYIIGTADAHQVKKTSCYNDIYIHKS